MEAIMAVVASRAFIQQDRPTLEWEVATYSDLCPWREGQEEPAMDQMSTIMVKPECKEKNPLPGASNVEVVYDTSTGTATRADHCGSLLEQLRLSYARAR
jgi:hypothetical protein